MFQLYKKTQTSFQGIPQSMLFIKL